MRYVRRMPSSRILVLAIGALLLGLAADAQAWEYRRPEKHRLHLYDLHMAPLYACALLDQYGPSKQEHMIEVVIPKSPYGPIGVSMDWTRVIEISVENARFPTQPDEATFEKIRTWVIAQLREDPPPCRVVLSKPEYASVKLEIAGAVGMLSDAEYVIEHLRLSELAARKGDVDMASKWSGSAFAQFSAIPAKEKQALKQDPRLHRAAYDLVSKDPPDGLSDLGRRGYCDMYRRIGEWFPPKTKDERDRLRRVSQRCR